MSALTPLYLIKLQYYSFFFLNKGEMVMYQGSAGIKVVSLTEKLSRDLMRVTLLCQGLEPR